MRFEDELRARKPLHEDTLAPTFTVKLTREERDALAALVAAARWECDHLGASEGLLNALARLDGAMPS